MGILILDCWVRKNRVAFPFFVLIKKLEKFASSELFFLTEE